MKCLLCIICDLKSLRGALCWIPAIICALVLLPLVASQAAALELTVNDARVYNCAAIAPEGERTPACLGQAAQDCQLQSGGDTTNGIASCIAAETVIWDEILNSEYGATRGVMQAGDAANQTDLATALRTSQRAWIAFRDAECDLTAARWQGGSAQAIAVANCNLVLTAERALALRDMRPR